MKKDATHDENKQRQVKRVSWVTGKTVGRRVEERQTKGRMKRCANANQKLMSNVVERSLVVSTVKWNGSEKQKW